MSLRVLDFTWEQVFVIFFKPAPVHEIVLLSLKGKIFLLFKQASVFWILFTTLCGAVSQLIATGLVCTFVSLDRNIKSTVPPHTTFLEFCVHQDSSPTGSNQKSGGRDFVRGAAQMGPAQFLGM